MSLLFVFLVAYITKNVAIQVQVSKGTLQGEEVKVNDGTVYVFKSIPYAEPPVDNLRFKKPVEIANSDSVIDTTVYTSTCPNGFDLLTPQNVSEDCLYFSVFANKNCLEKACPVVFFVHDAINEPLSTSDFDELNVAEKFAFDDIVFVRPKYRSSIYGFLEVSKPIDEAPFNVGLHDLKLALNFVYKEINAFGGDPTKITVFGSSYGADLALLLLNSPQIRHIPIYQAILFNGMPSVGGGHSQNATQNVLKMLKCEYDQDEVPLNSTESLDCLYDKSTDELERAVFQTQTSETYWGPRFDQDLIPANDHEQLRDLWQPIPLLLILYAPTSNTDHAPNLDAAESCEILLPYFGYYSNSTLNKCVEFYSSDNRKSYSDALYAYTVKMARMNNAKGSTSYIGIIGEKVDNPDKIKFFVENATEIETDNEAKIISKYNEKIRRFIKGLDGDWTPSHWHGDGYYLFDFPTQDKESTDFHGGVMINGSYFNEEAVKFWLNDLAIEEVSNSEEEETLIAPLIENRAKPDHFFNPIDSDTNKSSSEATLQTTLKESKVYENTPEINDHSPTKTSPNHGKLQSYFDYKTIAERELEVQTVWVLFTIILCTAILLAILVIALCVCLLREKSAHQKKYHPRV